MSGHVQGRRGNRGEDSPAFQSASTLLARRLSPAGGLAPDFRERRHLGQRRNRKRARKGRGWQKGGYPFMKWSIYLKKKKVTENFFHLFASINLYLEITNITSSSLSAHHLAYAFQE